MNRLKRVILAALLCTMSQAISACNQQPPPPQMTSGEGNTAKIDPFDGPGAPHKGAATGDPKPGDAKPASPDAKPAVTESDLGIPFYPGATPYTQPGNSTDASITGNGITATLLQTGDPIDKVIAFYQNKLTGPDESGKPSPPSRRDDTRDGKSMTTITRIDGRTSLAAVIRQSDHLTIIELMHMEIPADLKANLPGGLSGATSGSASGATRTGETGASPSSAPLSGAAGTPGAPANGMSPGGAPGTSSAGKPGASGVGAPPKRSLQYP
jgi:hypothetical protein